MQRRSILSLAIVLIAINPCPAWADGLKTLENFLHAAKSGRAAFTQVVTAPPRDGQPARSKRSSGVFEFQRPDRFRFTYRKPFAQSIVADGRTLWFFDVDLNQVTARAQAGALGSTPAALIAAAPDLKALRAEFELNAAPEQDGLQWVDARPKAREGQLQNLRIGFQGETLAALEIVDSFGQHSVLRFSQFELNPALPADTFEFHPPPGADVIRQ